MVNSESRQIGEDVLDHFGSHDRVDLEEGGGRDLEIAVQHLHHEVIAARHDDGVLFINMRDRNAGFDLQLRAAQANRIPGASMSSSSLPCRMETRSMFRPGSNSSWGHRLLMAASGR